jgi:nucleotidyltransferase/DNA polymerase involved in DNA repair
MRETIVLEFMKSIPFTKIRNLGGKLGNEVENALNIQTAGDLWYVDEWITCNTPMHPIDSNKLQEV